MKANTKKRAFFIAVGISTLILTASCVRADEPQPVDLPKLYVGKFEPVERAPNGFGPLHALNAGIRRIKADSTKCVKRLLQHMVENLRYC